jgi:membrane protein implicated in regulation of membrane protease activity
MINLSSTFKNKPLLFMMGVWVATLVYFTFASDLLIIAIVGSVVILTGLSMISVPLQRSFVGENRTRSRRRGAGDVGRAYCFYRE